MRPNIIVFCTAYNDINISACARAFLETHPNNIGLHPKWDVMAHMLRRLLSTGGSWVRLPLWPSRRDLGQVLYLQLSVRFGVKPRYSIRAVVGSSSEW